MVVGLFPAQHTNTQLMLPAPAPAQNHMCQLSTSQTRPRRSSEFEDRLKHFVTEPNYQPSFHSGCNCDDNNRPGVSRSNTCRPSPEHGTGEPGSHCRSAETFGLWGLSQTPHSQKQRLLVRFCCLRGSFLWVSFLSFAFVGHF